MLLILEEWQFHLIRKPTTIAFSRSFSFLVSVRRVERSQAAAPRVLLPWLAIAVCTRAVYVITMSAQIWNGSPDWCEAHASSACVNAREQAFPIFGRSAQPLPEEVATTLVRLHD